jgi:hypothetical protein
MKVAEGVMLDIALSKSAGEFELEAHVNLATALDGRGVWHVGLAAVVEETNGCLSYWALTHPPGKPDFHHRDSFALALSQ